MRTRYFLMIMVSMMVAVGSTFAQKKTTVHGELVEVTSYVKEGVKPTSPAGKEISIENVKRGGSLAVMEKGTSKIYFLAPSSPNDMNFPQTVSAYFGIKVAVKGVLYKRSGINLIVVEDIGKSIK